MISKKTTGKLSIFHVPLDASGYDSSGRYYGRTSESLWKICLEEPGEGEPDSGWTEDFVRADNRQEAKDLFPNATWEGEEEEVPVDSRDPEDLRETIADYARTIASNHLYDLDVSKIFTQYPDTSIDIFQLDMDEFKNFLEKQGNFYEPGFEEDQESFRQEVSYYSDDKEELERCRQEKREELYPAYLEQVNQHRAKVQQLTASIDPANQDLSESTGSKDFWEVVNGVAEFFEQYQYFGYFVEEIYEDKASDLLVDDLRDLLLKVASETTSFEVIHDLSVTVDEIDKNINVQEDYWKRHRNSSQRLYQPMAMALLEGINANSITPLMVLEPDLSYEKSIYSLLQDILREANRGMWSAYLRLKTASDREAFVQRWKEKISQSMVEVAFVHDQHRSGDGEYLFEIIQYNSLPHLAQMLETLRGFLPVSLEDFVGPFDWMNKT